MKRLPKALTRRQLLHGLGISAGLAPLLPLLNASAQSPRAIKRLVLIFQPDGAPARDYNNTVDFKPQGSQTDFSFHPIHAPYAAHQSKVVLPWGMKLTAGGAGEAHAFGMAGLWTASTLHQPGAGADFDGGNGNRTGWGSGPSIDQIVASASGPESPYSAAPDAPNQETPFRSVELGVYTLNPTSLNRMIYTGDNAPVHPENDPRAAFQRLLGNVTPSGDAPAADPLAAQRQVEEAAVVDWLRDDLGRLKRRIGSEDYAKVDAHLEGLLAIEQRINTTGASSPASLACSTGMAPGGSANYAEQLRQMMDIMVGALSCDVTRVISLQMSYAFSHITHTWLGHNNDHHNMSHDGSDRTRELAEIDTWYSEQVAYLLTQMDSVSEGDGTLLDNSLVVVGRELGSTAHRMDRWPVVLAGGAGGALRGGRWLDVEGREHAQLLVSIAQLMGVDISSVGNRAPDSGPLPGLIS